MTQKLPSEFWQWAREKGLPPRKEYGNPDNAQRALMMFPLINEWRRLHRTPQ